jgi:hypothetical protein
MLHQKMLVFVNDCEVILCPSSSSSTNDDDITNITNENHDEFPKWCPNYVVKEVQPEEEGSLG